MKWQQLQKLSIQLQKLSLSFSLSLSLYIYIYIYIYIYSFLIQINNNVITNVVWNYLNISFDVLSSYIVP